MSQTPPPCKLGGGLNAGVLELQSQACLPCAFEAAPTHKMQGGLGGGWGFPVGCSFPKQPADLPAVCAVSVGEGPLGPPAALRAHDTLCLMLGDGCG